MYVMPVFTPNMFASSDALYIAGSSSLPLFRDEPTRLGFVKVFEKALSAAFPENPVKRAGFLDDFQYDQLVGVIRIIQATFTPPYSIIIYSLYGMGEVQRGLKAADEHQGGSSKEALQVTKFIMVKVSCDARLFLSINLQTCMFTGLLVTHDCF